MTSGGEREAITAAAKQILCGQAFLRDAPLDAACVARVQAEIGSAYAAVGKDGKSVARLEGFLRRWYGLSYFACSAESRMDPGGLGSEVFGANRCLQDFANGKRKIAVTCRPLNMFGKGGYVPWAVGQVKAGVGVEQHFADVISIPPRIERRIAAVASGDRAIAAELARLYRDAMRSIAAKERSDSEIQDGVAASILKQAKQQKRTASAGELRDALAATYVSEVVEKGERSDVVTRQVPKQLLERIAASCATKTLDLGAVQQLRRIYHDAERDAMSARGLSESRAHRREMERLRPRIVEALGRQLEPITARLLPEYVADELDKYDVMQVRFGAEDEEDPTIAEIVLQDVRPNALDAPAQASLSKEERAEYLVGICQHRVERGRDGRDLTPAGPSEVSKDLAAVVQRMTAGAVADPCEGHKPLGDLNRFNLGKGARTMLENRAAICEEAPKMPPKQEAAIVIEEEEFVVEEEVFVGPLDPT
jgi:hypothetical protein